MSSINCPNKNKAIASFIANASDPARSSWDLTPYKTAGIAKPGGTWRLFETGYNLLYYRGVVAADGTLTPEGYKATAAGVATRQTRETTPK